MGKQLALFGPPGRTTASGFLQMKSYSHSACFRPTIRISGCSIPSVEFLRGSRFDPGVDDPAIWSTDGQRIVWASNRAGAFDLYVKSANGAGAEQLLIKMGTPTGWAEDWSRDGRFVLYQIPGRRASRRR